MEGLTSRRHPLVQHVRRLLSTRSYRRLHGEMVLEGTKMLGEALAQGGELSLLFLREGTVCPPEIPDTVPGYLLPKDLFDWLADTKTPQGLLFVCRIPTQKEVCLRRGFLVLDGLQDPGNVGTIWRTADAFGAAGLILLPGCADPYAPKTLRAGMGACFRLPLWECSVSELADLLRETKCPLLAATLSAEAQPLAHRSPGGASLVIGNEGQGVSEAVRALCSGEVYIPMRAHCESLNAAVAAAVLLWEMREEAF